VRISRPNESVDTLMGIGTGFGSANTATGACTGVAGTVRDSSGNVPSLTEEAPDGSPGDSLKRGDDLIEGFV
jgi:hypothetical protein